MLHLAKVGIDTVCMQEMHLLNRTRMKQAGKLMTSCHPQNINHGEMQFNFWRRLEFKISPIAITTYLIQQVAGHPYMFNLSVYTTFHPHFSSKLFNF